jgi:hypothetical protein
LANVNQKVIQPPAEGHPEIGPRAVEIARKAVRTPDLLERIKALAPELKRQRRREVPFRRYTAGLERTIEIFVHGYVGISTQLDRGLERQNPLETHLAAAEADALWMAKGMWEALRFMPAMDAEGRVAVEAPSRQLKPVTGIKGELGDRGISDDNRNRSLSVIQPERVLKGARFGLQGSTSIIREAEATRLLGVDGAQPRAHNGAMCLSVLAAAVAAAEIAVEGFSVNVVRARLPGGHVRRKRVVRAGGAGADVFTVEMVAWCRMADGSCCRLRILDLALTPEDDPALGPSISLVQEQIVKSLEIVDQMLPEAPRVLVLPYDLPLGPPRGNRDVLTTRISDHRLADHVRAQPEHRVPAADFVAELAPLLPLWTMLGAVEPGRSNVFSLQQRIRADRKRAAFVVKTLRNHQRIEWLVTTPGAWQDKDHEERLRQLALEWQGEMDPEGLDQRRPAGHRVMFHGNFKEETVDALTQAFLAYTLAEEIDHR